MPSRLSTPPFHIINESVHTTGPWHSFTLNGKHLVVSQDELGSISPGYEPELICTVTNEVDAKLIAAAPGMQETLRKVLKLSQQDDPAMGLYKDVNPYELFELVFSVTAGIA